MRQPAPILRQARWETEARAELLAQRQRVWGTLWSKLPPPFQRGKGGGAVRLASQAADEGGSCISPYTWGQGTSCRPGIKKQGETGRKQRSHMTGRGAQRDREQERGPWTCEDCQDLQVKVAGTGCPPVPQTVTARQCPWGDQPSWVPAKPCCPTAGTDGPCEIRVHWASGFPGWAISVACLGSDRGRPPWRLASGRLSAHRCPLHRNSYLWELIGSPLAPEDANSAGSSRVHPSPHSGSGSDLWETLFLRQ